VAPNSIVSLLIVLLILTESNRQSPDNRWFCRSAASVNSISIRIARGTGEHGIVETSQFNDGGLSATPELPPPFGAGPGLATAVAFKR
jgi:hypothetical protein